MSDAPFLDRHAAGIELAARLPQYRSRHDVVVLALPRGGVPVAFEVAEALQAPLDVLVVRKLGMPGHPEFAIGALASGVRILSEDVIQRHGVSPRTIEALAGEELAELERREREYRQGRPLIDLRDRIVLLVDDGLATGSTMRAAVAAVRTRGPARVVVAVPVGASAACTELSSIADEVVCARTPEWFEAVGSWYRDFSQTGSTGAATPAETRRAHGERSRPRAAPRDVITRTAARIS